MCICGFLAYHNVHVSHVLYNIVQVAVGEDEPQDNAIKRFRRAVMNTGLLFEVR